MSRLGERVAVVTGGGSGIGRAITLALASEGATVIVGDVNEAGAAETADLVQAAGGMAAWVRADITQADEVEALMGVAGGRFGRLDILVNNAGICRVVPFALLEAADVEAMWRVHALGTFLCSQAAVRQMTPARFGRIVNIVSGPGGYGTSVNTAHYQAAKSAQTSLGRSLSLACAADGITVNAVSPGTVITPLWESMDDDYKRHLGRSAEEEIATRLADPASFPLGRAPLPEEIADLVVYLCLPTSGAITGAVIDV